MNNQPFRDHIEELADLCDEKSEDQSICGVDVGRTGPCNAYYTLECAAKALRLIGKMLDEHDIAESMEASDPEGSVYDAWINTHTEVSVAINKYMESL